MTQRHYPLRKLLSCLTFSLTHLVISKKMKGKLKKNLMITFKNSKLGGQLAYHVWKIWCQKKGSSIQWNAKYTLWLRTLVKIIGYKWDPLIKQHGYQNVMWDMPKLGVKNNGEYITMHTWRTWSYMFIGILSLFWSK